jgi:hypothetical protein
VRENIYYGAQVIKLVADQKPYYYTEAEVRAAVDEAHRAGRKVAVHVAGGPAARNVINAGADSIEHGFDLTTQDLELMRERGTFSRPPTSPSRNCGSSSAATRRSHACGPTASGASAAGRQDRRRTGIWHRHRLGRSAADAWRDDDRLCRRHIAAMQASSEPEDAAGDDGERRRTPRRGAGSRRGCRWKSPIFVALPANPLDDLDALRVRCSS